MYFFHAFIYFRCWCFGFIWTNAVSIGNVEILAIKDRGKNVRLLGFAGKIIAYLDKPQTLTKTQAYSHQAPQVATS
jgi:hypothetical protein